MEIYVLQILENDDVGTIRDIDVTQSESKAKKWFNKKLKTTRYTHGYYVTNV